MFDIETRLPEFKKSVETCIHKDKMITRIDLATANNCYPIGKNSAFAYMVGIPYENENVVIKIVDKHDGFLYYAKACHEGILNGIHMLKVYSIHELNNNYFLVVMERADRHLTNDELKVIQYNMHESDPLYEEYISVQNSMDEIMELFSDWAMDMGCNNIMKRKDNSLVIIDPIC
jgi:hypothetical protein